MIGPILYISDTYGVNIPKVFAEKFLENDWKITGANTEDLSAIHAGPDNEYYWEAWDDICRGAVMTDTDGVRYNIYHDNDLWLIPTGMEWSDKEATWVWPTEAA